MLPKLHLVSKYEVISVKKKVCPECGEEFDPAIENFNSVKCWGCNFDSASETADEFDSGLLVPLPGNFDLCDSLENRFSRTCPHCVILRP